MSLKFYRASNLFYDPPSRLRQTWRAGKNQLVKVVKPNGDTVEYTYDGEGKRVKKRVIASTGEAISTYYHYDGEGNIVLETDSDKNIKAKYIRDNQGKALALELPTPDSGLRTHYYLYNAHGDVTALTDSQGNTIATYTYDEFGNQVAGTGYRVWGTEIYNPLRYSGANNAYYDSETGLYKMGARYYDSSIGRWFTRDKYQGEKTEPLTKNSYVYGLNNPVTNIDSTGFAAWRSKRPIRSSDRFNYREWVYNNFQNYIGKTYSSYGKVDCADFAMLLLMDYAARKKLSMRLIADNGDVLKSTSNKYNSEGDYWRDAKAKISAAGLADPRGKAENTKKLKNWSSIQRGDLIIFKWLDGSGWDTTTMVGWLIFNAGYSTIRKNEGEAVQIRNYWWAGSLLDEQVYKDGNTRRPRRWYWQ